MNRFIGAAGMAALLAVAGCGDSKDDAAGSAGAAPSEAASAAPDAAASPPAAAAAGTPAAGSPPTKEFIVGKWGEAGDCALAIDFKADGTMDGPFDGWTWDGKDLTMPPNPAKMTLTVVDAKTMESRREGDKPRKLTRC